MNKYSEVKTRPSYSYKVQKLANALPSWTTARKDKHSNYQSILSDLIDPITDLIGFTRNYNFKMLATETDIFDSAKVYTYIIENAPKEQKESFTFFKAPISVTVDDSDLACNGYSLVECPNDSVEDLNNRLPLEVKSLIDKNPAVDIISQNGVTKEICIFVKEICYLGIYLSSVADIVPENFYMKQGNTYSYSLVYLKNLFNIPVQGFNLFPFRSHNFIDPVHPGIYYISFDLIEDTQLNDFTIEVYPNFSFPTADKNFFYDTYIDANSSKIVYTNINGEYLELIEKNSKAHSEFNNSLGAIDSFTMLDENDSALSISSYVKRDMLMYALSEEDSSKLYCYDLFLNGNSYIYENNENYLYEIVLNELDYKIGDEIILESRQTKLFSTKKVRSIRLKVENYESSGDPEYSPYYINESGDVFANPDKAWRDVDTYEKKWKFTIETIGSYRFTIEALYADTTTAVVGVKLMLVNYKVPYKVFNLPNYYSGWNLGISPDNQIELINPDDGSRKIIEFYKDGYYFDQVTGNIWTNYPFTSISVEYE